MERRPNTTHRFTCRLDWVFVFLQSLATAISHILNLLFNLTLCEVAHTDGLALAVHKFTLDDGVSRLSLNYKLNFRVFSGDGFEVGREKLTHTLRTTTPVAVSQSDLLALEMSVRTES